MHRIVERPKALEDLDGIADYIAADNPPLGVFVVFEGVISLLD